MANTFTSYVNKDVGTAPVAIVTVGAGVQTTLIGMSCANTTTAPVTVDAYITRSAVNYYLIKGATVPVGGTLVVIGGEQKVVLVAADSLNIVSSTATSVDSVVSALNIS